MSLLLKIIAVLMLQTPAAVALQSQTGTASGVLRTATGEPAVGIRVAAVAIQNSETNPGEGALLSLSQTDNTGRFRLENIVPGRYYIQAGLIDAPTYYPGVTNTTGATSILVTAGAAINDLNFSMSRGSVGVRVSGRVPIATGRPVLIMMRATVSPTTSVSSQVKPDGSFEFLKVAPGNYTLTGVPSNGLPAMQNVVTDHDIEVGTHSGSTVTVSGTVGLGPRSPRPSGMKVILSGSDAWSQPEGTLNPDGTFSIANVPSGTYALKTKPGGVSSIATVIVGDRAISGVSVPGYVEVPGKAEIDGGRQFSASSTALMIEAKSERGQAFATAIRSDGSFRFPLLEGRYRISFGSLPAGMSVKSFFYGAVDLMKDLLILDGSSDLRELHVVFDVQPAR